jgi:hypothetical protein
LTPADTLPRDVTRRLNLWLETFKSAVFIDVLQIGAGGGTRTHTTFYSHRILSPVRLPFRHTGNLYFIDDCDDSQIAA